MKTLVLGASGATGRFLVSQLLSRGHDLKVIVRPASIPPSWHSAERITVIGANISEITPEHMSDLLQDCQSVASCLGHNITLRGIYGKPRKLVTDAIRLICQAAQRISPAEPLKLVLMNTAGCRNKDLDDPIPFKEKLMVGTIRLLLPPHRDNESAAEHLRVNVGSDDPYIQWVVVRPDNLLNADDASEYEVYPSPVRSAIFNPGQTSRINVAHFMARLLHNPDVWNRWKGSMPVIYNKS